MTNTFKAFKYFIIYILARVGENTKKRKYLNTEMREYENTKIREKFSIKRGIAKNRYIFTCQRHNFVQNSGDMCLVLQKGIIQDY